MELKLPNSIFSRQDLKALIMEIRQYAGWVGQNTVKKKVTGQEISESPAISGPAAEMVEQWHTQKQPSRDSLDELVAALERLDAAAPRLTITLAAPASGNLKQNLVNWCRQNIAKDILVDFRFNSTILGGMVISYGSHIFDWSFRRQILAGRGRFPEALRRV